jgi:hypothetical protein
MRRNFRNLIAPSPRPLGLEQQVRQKAGGVRPGEGARVPGHLDEATPVGEQAGDGLGEDLFGQLAFFDRDGGSRGREHPGVLALVAVRRRAEWNEDRRATRRRELR